MNPYLMEPVDASGFRPLTRRTHEEARRLSEASVALAIKQGVKMTYGTTRDRSLMATTRGSSRRS